MIYEKTNEGFHLTNDGTSIKNMSKVGFVVDCLGYPKRDPIVIKHGEFERVEKYYNELQEHAEKMKLQGDDFSGSLQKSTHLIEVTDWTADEINSALDMDAKKILLSKNINIPTDVLL